MKRLVLTLVGLAGVLLLAGCGGGELLEAVKANDAEAVRALLEDGVSANVKGPDGYRPLHMACEQGNVEIVRLLLGNGADVEAREDRGRVPLPMAAEKGHIQVVQLLLANGA